jgi:hypothetical protein
MPFTVEFRKVPTLQMSANGGKVSMGQVLTTLGSDVLANATAAAASAAAAATAETNAETAETNAETAQAAAEVAQAAAEAVGSTNDGIMTGVDANAASAFRVQSDARQLATIDARAIGEMVLDVARHADGTVAAFDTGQAAINFGISPLVVTSGALGHPVISANNGGYIEGQLAGFVCSTTMRFSFPATTAGIVVIAWPEAEWGDGTHVDFALVAGLHLQLTRTTWSAGSYDGPSAGASSVTYASGTYATALPVGVEHEVTCWLDRNTGTLTILLPDGTVTSMTNSLLLTKTSAYVVAEAFESLITQTSATITYFAASSTLRDGDRATRASVARAIENNKPRKPQAKVYNPGIVETTAITSSGTLVPALEVESFTVPPSGSMLIEWSGYIAMTGTAGVYMAALWGGTVLASEQVVVASQFSGRVQGRFLITGLTPYATSNIRFRLLASVNSTTTYEVGSAGSAAKPTVISVREVVAL